jgi:hypothetical protein
MGQETAEKNSLALAIKDLEAREIMVGLAIKKNSGLARVRYLRLKAFQFKGQ